MKQSLNKKNFATAVAVSMLLALMLLLLSYFIGKENLFLLLNTDAGNSADIFFKFFTYAGDGLTLIPLLIIVLLLLKRKDTFLLLITTFSLSTIFAQFFKYIVYPNMPRPLKAIPQKELIHTVDGVDIHLISTFPSGHTITAFCIYFLFCLLLPGKWWLITGFIYAVLVGYSRVYLAQHFPLDIGAGIIFAVVSVWFAMQLQQLWWKRKKG